MLKLAELNVPVLVQAYPDDPARLDVARRGDAFCGKISLTNNLFQYGIPFSLTEWHTIRPVDPRFHADLDKRLGVCRVVRGNEGDAHRRGRRAARDLQHRPLLGEAAAGVRDHRHDGGPVGVFGAAQRLSGDDNKVKAKLEEICDYIHVRACPDAALVRMAKMGVVLDDWIAFNEVDATAIQCWTSIQQNYGINACTLMSMYSDS